MYSADGNTHLKSLGRVANVDQFHRCKTLESQARYLQHFFLFRKGKLLEIGGADESLGDFPGIDDYDMIWVMLEQGASVAIAEQVLYNYRDHEGERLSLKPAQQAMEVLERIFDKHSVAPSEREEIRDLHLQWYGEPLHRAYSRIYGTPH